MGLSLLSGILVALFLRKFIGLNLFKTQDKVSERAVLTIVTQVPFLPKLPFPLHFIRLDSPGL